MTYPVFEISVDNGKPVYLFEISYSGQAWYYTSSDTPLTNNGKTYLPVPISASTIPGAMDATRANMTVTLARDLPVAEIFRVQPPSEVVSLVVFAEHANDPDNQFMALWRGRITNCEWQGSSIVLTSDSVFTSFLRNGLGPRFSRQCTTTIYSDKCGVLRDNFKTSGPATTVMPGYLLVPASQARGDNYFAGGIVTWSNNTTGNTERRLILSSTASDGKIVISSSPPGLAAGQAVSLYPGCDHVITTCDSKFNNVVNYRGTPYIPAKSPFGGTTLF